MAFHEGDCTVSSEKGHIKLAKFLLDFILNDHVAEVEINAAGTGYTVNDVLAIAGGTVVDGMTADAVVTSVGGSGEVTGLRLHNWGAYSADPTLTGNGLVGGTGSGCTADLTMEVGTWTQDRSTYVDNNTEFEFIVHGVNGSGNDPYAGITTATQSGIPMWIPKFFTGYNGALSFSLQPGANAPSVLTADGPRVPLVDTQMHFFFFCSGRRFIAIPRNAPTYEWLYLGLFFPFVLDPANDYPLPLVCSGTTMRAGETMASPWTDLHAALAHHGNNGDAHLMRWADGSHRKTRTDNTTGSWYIHPAYSRVVNSEMTAPDLNGGFFQAQLTTGTNVVGNGWLGISNSGQTSDAAPAPFGTNGRTFMIWPCTLNRDDPGACECFGELEGVFAIQGRGIAAEDRVTLNGERFIAFPNVNSNDLRSFYAIREG